MNGLTRELGAQQGRVHPAGWAAAEGSCVFVLGSDAEGRFARFNLGDYAEVSQAADFAGVKVLRVRAFLRPPAAPTPGAAWEFSARIDGAARITQRLEPGRPRARRDFALNLSTLTAGPHTLAFRVELVAA
jgi:hypothetical protein